ncbi:hypothetical protein HAX54_005060, partial [Datura stramonium]|nr:hypothetical protein [Datura stramonium]
MAPPPLRRYRLRWVTEKEDRILTLGLGFMFNAPSDYNLNMALNRLLGTPNVDPPPFVDMVKKPPYRNIRHTLCGPNSIARWTRHQQFG